MTSVSERNKGKIRLFVEAVWNHGQLELIDELVAADYLGYVSGLEQGVVGPEGVRRLVSSRRLAYPDLYVKIEDQVAEHDLVVTRWRATATTPTSPAAAGWAGVSVVRLLAGKQVDAHTALTRGTAELAT